MKIILRNIIKYKLYYLLGLIFFIVNFKNGRFYDVSIPVYILFFMDNSVYIASVLMLLSLILNLTKILKKNKISSGVFFFFLFQAVVILSSKEKIDVILQRMIFLLIVFYYFIYVVSTLKLSDIILAICCGIFLHTLINFICYFYFPSLFSGGRLSGISGHPNYTGIVSAFSITFSLYYLLFQMQKRSWFLIMVCIIMVCIGISVCIFSDSRNSIGMILVSLFYFLFCKVENNSLKILIIAIILLLLLILFNLNLRLEDIDYTGRSFNRDKTWAILMKEAMQFNLFGIGRIDINATANSYLFAIAASGIIGAIFFFLSIYEIIKKYFIEHKRKYLNHIILFRSLILTMAFSALLEGFLLDQISIPVYLYWFLLVININGKIYVIKKKGTENSISHRGS
ncbi:MAG: hypothetical protein FWF54_07320 [Candidatus Azobacteroides sp.]|nr:hypothetical protein [Candidatus Azobacteroides sp.]